MVDTVGAVTTMGVFAMIGVAMVATQMADTVQSEKRSHEESVWFAKIAACAGLAVIGHFLILLLANIAGLT